MSDENVHYIWIGRFTGTLSFMGSSLIIYVILSDMKRKLGRPYHRLMLVMSVFDVIQKIALIVSVAAVPRESNIYGANGNMSTCMVQGFFLVLGMTVPLYNSCLNIYYVLTIRYRMSSRRFAKFEPFFHAVSIFVPLSMAIYFTSRGHMAPIMNCGCSARGKIPILIMESLFAFCFLVCIISMITICWTVVSQAIRMKKYTTIRAWKKSHRRNRGIEDEKNETLKQAFLYVLAFIMTYIFPFIGAVLTKGKVGAVPPYAVMVLTSIFYPLQGFSNLCFYIRPGVNNLINNAGQSPLRAIRNVLFNPESTSSKPRRSRSAKPQAPSQQDVTLGSNSIAVSETDVKENTEGLDNDTDPTQLDSDISTDFLDTSINHETANRLESNDTASKFSTNLCHDEVHTSTSKITEDRLESQAIVRPRRRLSLVYIASVVNVDWDDDVDSDDNSSF